MAAVAAIAPAATLTEFLFDGFILRVGSSLLSLNLCLIHLRMF